MWVMLMCLSRLCGTVCSLLAAATIVLPGRFALAEPPASDDRITQLVWDLDDERFSVREAASKSLAAIGRPAIKPLSVAASSDSAEVSYQALRILVRLLGSTNEESRRESEQALFDLTSAPHAEIAARARFAMRPLAERLATELRRGGASVTVDDNGDVSVNIDKTEQPAPLMPLIRRLPGLTDVSASNRKVDDKCLAHLAGHPTLKYLNLFESGISDESLKVFKTLPSLRSIPMGHAKVTDAGLAHLAGLTRLEYVGLRGDDVTDAGLHHLYGLTNLNSVYLGESKVTAAGVARLRRALPNLKTVIGWEKE
jgi:hypothetical protein